MNKKKNNQKNKTDEIKNSEKEKNEVVKNKKFIFRLLRIVFLWIPLCTFILILSVLIIAKLYLSPKRVEKLAIQNFNKASTGTLQLNVEKFNPYGEIIISNIIVKNSENFDKSDFLKIDKIVFKYGIFDLIRLKNPELETGLLSFLLVNLHIDEIGIYNPSIYLTQKKKIWNFQDLFPAGENDKEPAEDPSKDREVSEEDDQIEPELKDEVKSNILKLPVFAEMLFYFNLENLNVYIDSDTFSSRLEGFSISTDLYIPPFSRVPLDPSAVKILKKMEVKVNPSQKLNFTFSSKEASVKPPLIFSLNLIYFNENPGKKNASFKSGFKFGTYRNPIRFQNTHLIPMNFLVSYDLFFDPATDYLDLKSLKIKFNSSEWINLKGNISDVSTEQKLNLRMSNSRINLNELYPYYRQLTKDEKMKFSGGISLYPLTIKGTPDLLYINSSILINDFTFNMPDLRFSTPNLSLSNKVILKPTSALINTDLNMKRFLFTLGRSASKYNGISLSSNIYAYNSFKKFRINSLNLKHFNPASGKNSVDMYMNGNIDFSKNLSGNVNITKLIFQKKPLIEVMPQSIAKSLKAIPLEKDTTLSLSSSFSLGASIIKANANIFANIPDFSINDLVVKADILQNKRSEKIFVNRASVQSKHFGLNSNISGFVEMKGGKPLTDSDIKARIKVAHKKTKNVYGPWLVSGDANVNMDVKGPLEDLFIKGNVDINDFNLANNDKSSQLSVEKLNMDFPFEYFLKTTLNKESTIEVNKADYIANENFSEKENFSLKSFKMKNPSKENQLELVSDLSGTMFFKNNMFEIKKLKATSLGGHFLMKDTLFYPADLKTENMEYKLQMELINLDVSKIQRASKISKSAQLSFNTNISGKGLDFKKDPEIKGTISIYKIGRRFASYLMKGLSQSGSNSKVDKYTRFAMDNSLSVKNIYYYIDNGNIYTTVTFIERALAFFISVKEQKVEFQRMPINEYLKSIMSSEEENNE